MEKLESDVFMDSEETHAEKGHRMMGSDEGMMSENGMMQDRMEKVRAEDGDTVEPLKRVVQPQVKFYLG